MLTKFIDILKKYLLLTINLNIILHIIILVLAVYLKMQITEGISMPYPLMDRKIGIVNLTMHLAKIIKGLKKKRKVGIR